MILLLNTAYQAKLIKKIQNKQTSEFFVEAKTEKDKSTVQALQNLKWLIDDEKTSEEDREELITKYMNIVLAASSESQTEDILKGLGYEETVVYVSDKIVTVIIRANNKLNKKQMMQIEEITRNVTGIDEVVIYTKP